MRGCVDIEDGGSDEETLFIAGGLCAHPPHSPPLRTAGGCAHAPDTNPLRTGLRDIVHWALCRQPLYHTIVPNDKSAWVPHVHIPDGDPRNSSQELKQIPSVRMTAESACMNGRGPVSTQ